MVKRKRNAGLGVKRKKSKLTSNIVTVDNEAKESTNEVAVTQELVCSNSNNINLGHERNDDEQVVSTNWGGKRTKNTQESYKAHLDESISSIHNDAMLVMAESSYRDVATVAGRSDDDDSLSQSDTRNLQDIVLAVDDLA